MVIFHSYVSQPEGNHGKCRHWPEKNRSSPKLKTNQCPFPGNTGMVGHTIYRLLMLLPIGYSMCFKHFAFRQSLRCRMWDIYGILYGILTPPTSSIGYIRFIWGPHNRLFGVISYWAKGFVVINSPTWNAHLVLEILPIQCPILN